ncbi:AAA family ATPase [Dyadobacter sp. CY261]|uniref:AAA family ATPase n=1 Tax=Dyadobacter sp. CY261 TaxID=2907203 RepID=UPI00271497C2|nr:AAA family ATPase [Dyadobacter sp. CY261]
MTLVERSDSLDFLTAQLRKASESEGHCVLICGEAGIGKTSLTKAFYHEHSPTHKVFTGTCDALFSPRPLAPLYDIAMQMGYDLHQSREKAEDRVDLFTKFFHAITATKEQTIVVFEDIHWADEATLDFVKFFSRRIAQTRCLFLLTYRDNEISSRHPLRNVLGEMVAGTYSRLPLYPLSKEAVDKLAEAKGHRGEDVHGISGGNPFYVNEILASYSPGVPDKVKDSILSVYLKQNESTQRVWEILSVMPTGLEFDHLLNLDPAFEPAIEDSLSSRILNLDKGNLVFKHELYRRTIEQSLSPLRRIALNKQILQSFRGVFEERGQIERIIHLAKNANAHDLVVHYAPVAAARAATIGAHIEASRLYLSAIEYYQGNDMDMLVRWYEAYAYECYLTNQIKDAILYQGKALAVWKDKNDLLKMANSLRFLSRLWWFEGNREQAEKFGFEAIDALEGQPVSAVKATTYSNMSQLKMLSDEVDDCLFWGENAIAMAQELHNEEILCHALNNVGTVLLGKKDTSLRGSELLNNSLEIALKNAYPEHVARAYTNLGSTQVISRDYDTARVWLDKGIAYCRERELDSWVKYMLSFKARLALETGEWDEAHRIATGLLENEHQTPVVKISALTALATVKMRRREAGAPALLADMKATAFLMQEAQRIIPVLTAFLEYEWITGENLIEQETLANAIRLIEQTDNSFHSSEFRFWLKKARNQHLNLPQVFSGFDVTTTAAISEAALFWEQAGCAYQQAQMLFEGTEKQKKQALILVQDLSAVAVYEKMKQQMQAEGIQQIPRGMQQATRRNPAQLTNRELDILQMLARNLQYKEIADSLFISVKTVGHHISSIFLKLGVNSRGKAISEAHRLGIIKS